MILWRNVYHGRMLAFYLGDISKEQSLGGAQTGNETMTEMKIA
jgi:hypothetical protein